MKKLIIIVSIFSLMAIQTFSQTTDVKGLLNKPETRTEIFDAIFNDHQLMMEFMKAMKGNEHATMMMQNENHQMKHAESEKEMGDMKHKPQMMDHGSRMEMMKNNPEMMKQMMGNMMEMCEKDSVMQNTMTEMMAKHPEMMKTMIQKMKMNGSGLMKMDSMPMKNNCLKKKENLHQH